MDEINESQGQLLPVVPIRDGIVFPGTEMILTFGRQRSVSAIEAAHASGKKVVLVMQRNPNINDPTPSDLYQIATVGEIVQMMKNEGEINALVRGTTKVQIQSFEAVEPYFVARVFEVTDTTDESDETKALFNHLTNQLRSAVKLGKTMDFLTFMNIMSGITPLALSYHVAGVLDIKPTDRQDLLETSLVKDRLEKEISFLSKETKILDLEKKIASKTQEKFDKNVREQVLRERMKTIEKELGENDDNKEIKELADKIKKAGMPSDVRAKAEKELSRLAQMSPYNPEASYVRTYLDMLVELPWSVASPNNVNIHDAEEVLNKDHYGLKKIKERILEYLAVMKLKSRETQEGKPKSGRVSPTILCFVGPPGVGKTSIGKSIARALG
ncbi:MAG: endopeptidase La, partial [Spirochaetaceae bacterium]